ncbi:LysR family transcriptional regulator [Maritalea porphyrae]|uniref:LysR family transcriptional regulator n=2 Tax=Maritalea TaxID=623276 RepID=UPI0022AF4F37|nr:LysR family transcriptional regulator [Maritalea porphyrae]MCZ4270990.1 LysR family transcriptional regulator [Maritalea porphyrae]
MNNWDDYRFLLAINEAKNISRAARILNVNHGTVSRRLAALEERLGAVMFERNPDGYELTEAGLVMISAATTMKTALNDADQIVRASDKRLSGEVTFSAPEYLLLTVILPRMQAFHDEYPDIMVNFDSDDQIVSIKKHNADIALRVTADPAEGLVGRRLVARHLALYAARTYLDARQMNIEKPHRWIGRTNTKGRPDWVKRFYPDAKTGPRVKSNAAMHTAAQAGMGIAQLPCRIGDDDEMLQRVAPFQSVKDRDLWILYNPNMRQTPRLQVFAKFLSTLILNDKNLFDGTHGDSFIGHLTKPTGTVTSR